MKNEKDYFAGLTVCGHCGGSTHEPAGSFHLAGCDCNECTGLPHVHTLGIPVTCTHCGGTGVLGPTGEPAVEL